MTTARQDAVFYGWYIVAIAFVLNFVSVGSSFYIFNAFMEPLCKLHGWTRTDINLGLMTGMLFSLMGSFFYGTMIMRTGTRILILLGPMVSGAAFILLMRAQDLWLFNLGVIVLFLGNAAYGGIVTSTVVNNWFIMKRGRAIGIAGAGMSFSGAVLPFAAMLIILKSGIENASLYLGLMMIVIGPIAWLVIREWPEDHGLLPDGAQTPPPDMPKPASPANGFAPADSLRNFKSPWTLGLLVRTPGFWQTGIAVSIVMIGVVGVMSQLKPRFVDLGFDDKTAMTMMAITAFIGAIGKYAWGALCDRFGTKRVTAVLMLSNAAGLGLGLISESFIAMICFIGVFGFSMGGMASTYQILIADLFGRESYTTVFRFIAIFLVFQLLGYPIAGLSFDKLGSYDPAYMLFAVLDLLAAILIVTLKRPALPGPACETQEASVS